MKRLLLIVTCSLPIVAANIIGLQYKGVESKYVDDRGTTHNITIERVIEPLCLSLDISNDTLWEGEYASRTVPQRCTATLVTSVGQIQPMKLHKDVETFGELEVLDFIEKMQKNPNMILIDTRGEEWYHYRTIPSAKNLPYSYITKQNSFPKEFKEALKFLGVAKINGSYDFSQAKTVALFCNGSWCSQSPSMIKALLNLGYPATKIKWYRGGIHDWLGMSMTNTRP